MYIKCDEVNSQRFEKQMGNIVLSLEDISNEHFDVDNMLYQGKEQGFDHISIKVPTPNKALFNSLIKRGFYLTDTLLEYIFYFDGRQMPEIKHKTIIRDFNDSDIDSLASIAKDSFTYDRYHSDPNLDNSLCDKYYEQWLYNSCHGYADKVIVSEYNNEVVGFTTGKADHTQEYGHLVLSAVSDKYRGLGIYTSMIYEGVKWLETEGFKGVIVGTQINNLAVQKAWIKLGFTVLDSEYVLHYSY